MPLTCGRVCPAFCEDRCRRGDIDESIAIRDIKRFMADHEMAPALDAADKTGEPKDEEGGRDRRAGRPA